MKLISWIVCQAIRGKSKSDSQQGFTLLELLVAMILASIVIGSLLTFMLSILNTDRREQAKSASEQEIQAALEYISRDLQQALYVYDSSALTANHSTTPATSGIADQIPPVKAAPGCNTTEHNCTPVLAFWKRKLIDDVIPTDADDCDATPPVEGCDDAFVYSLVVYYKITDKAGTPSTWSKAARVGRFEIHDVATDFNGVALTEPARALASSGFAKFNPREADTLQTSMNSWVSGLATGAQYPDVTVLVDYIEQTQADSFQASVVANSNNSLVDVQLRGNALQRLQANASFNPNNSAFFPREKMRIQGRGLIGQ